MNIKLIDICKANKKVSLEVKNFILNVSNVKEESITDYLVWKWKELDKRFNYIKVSTFTRQEENSKSGADFELELWLIGREFHFSLVFQAKMLKENDDCVAKLKYPKGTKKQLKTLLSYAKTENKLPFYIFYGIPELETQVMCRNDDISDTAIFMADAYKIQEFIDGKYGSKISKNKLLEITHPFHCMFCCQLIQFGYFNYFRNASEHIITQENSKLPDYVNILLNRKKLSEHEMLLLIEKYRLRVLRTVGVYDMRGFEGRCFSR